ncbi:type I phosphomannose isomerase catalytic subunit [Paenibacillus cremeus]|uniref:Phosphohexomutase n=1 Tax=Paenibacillus cremeus TaxID=2163881 RepID=A0A559KA80_9BACL|nr:type I phosphomannose isomerase catalytic subunit [Paenibacillus cremeus]TVY09040.1 mannose-6-phosphate isomerase [Paenibacillus cremeus]
MKDYSAQPLKLRKNRVWRTYYGGRSIDEWQGASAPEDSSMPEEWIASVVRARNAGREQLVEGLSLVELDGADGPELKQLIEAEPAKFLGERHTAAYGSQTGVLVKALDSAERLTIQAHPDRSTAQRIFSSPFGKTEAWYILGGREIGGELPYILYGFKPGMTREKWEKLFWEQDIEGMIHALHKIPVEPGQVFIVEGGMPHAIGSGCFLIEIQEPTDFTIRVERTTPAGREIPEFMLHQGAGFERMFDCFRYDTYTLEDVLAQFRLSPRTIQESEEYTERSLISYATTPYFALTSLDIRSSCTIRQEDGFSILVVAQGAGSLAWGKECLQVTQGDQLFLPAGVTELQCERIGDEPLQLLRCFPPSVSP